MAHRPTSIARRLRREATSAEHSLWRVLNRRQIEGFRFRRQAPIAGCVVDFVCQDARLIIEIDGATHSTDAELAYDAARQSTLEAVGYSVLRFRNADLYEDIEAVAQMICLKLRELRPRVDALDDYPPLHS